jgi:hypothetical protein
MAATDSSGRRPTSNGRRRTGDRCCGGCDGERNSGSGCSPCRFFFPRRIACRAAQAPGRFPIPHRLHFAGADPRVALRQKTKIPLGEFKQIENTLQRLDSNNSHGSWTVQILRNIATNPGTPAAELAASIGAEKKWLKPNIRKLKALGLTESLSVGYRLSPRGRVVLGKLEGKRTRAAQDRLAVGFGQKKALHSEASSQHRCRRS